MTTTVFTSFTLTVLTTLETCLIALTIFFQAFGPFAIASFCVHFSLNFRLEGFRVSFVQHLFGFYSFHLELLEIMAANAIASRPTNFALSETVTVKF